ncbi:MAG TPA: hypothetical protein VHC23_08255 [Jatrophihabitans sp.]|nr:hypothetical protein [Jatrophihabitans sp.]
MGTVVGVVGGSGGVGASTFAAVLAAVAGTSALIDVDVVGGGIDVLLGVELEPGARWSGLHLAGGHLDPAVLLDGLPHWGRCAVLAADEPRLDPTAVRQVIEVAAAAGPAVLDLPRTPCPERSAALELCDLVVVLARGDACGLVAAHAVIRGLPDVPVGVVIRRGELPGPEAARLVDAPLLGELPPMGDAVDLTGGRLPRTARSVAAGVLAGAGAVG